MRLVSSKRLRDVGLHICGGAASGSAIAAQLPIDQLLQSEGLLRVSFGFVSGVLGIAVAKELQRMQRDKEPGTKPTEHNWLRTVPGSFVINLSLSL